MKWIGYVVITFFMIGFWSCSTFKSAQSSFEKGKSIQLTENDSDTTEYDVIIFDPGFESWLQKNRKPPWYYTKESLEIKNWQYVMAWNGKVRDSQFQISNSNNPFEQEIDYRQNIDYGMDVNYKLYYYFKYIEDSWGKFL